MKKEKNLTGDRGENGESGMPLPRAFARKTARGMRKRNCRLIPLPNIPLPFPAFPSFTFTLIAPLPRRASPPFLGNSGQFRVIPANSGQKKEKDGPRRFLCTPDALCALGSATGPVAVRGVPRRTSTSARRDAEQRARHTRSPCSPGRSHRVAVSRGENGSVVFRPTPPIFKPIKQGV